MKYTIGFRSGRVINITTLDQVNLVKTIADGIKDVPVNWFRDLDSLIQVNEIEFIFPYGSVEIVK